ncbi:Holliday junction branch migration protein RuvA [Kineothrix sp. MSJ-39]|uniref:Holliday junction branch migration protein RuvA n=1 Tax=Kineothrix sp. MSJ-39 TaxID=2841533 RepID=UPI001C123743|nr:Holliday junction branch migration protein RuvA [Kineothrix sp. MSJ-39]MBU5428666.1 Holliday junction branch migration protein RuvA [Kineothrix sp. MSJ-39]
MIGYVKGILEEIEEDCVIVDVNGLGIRILAGGALASQMLALGSEVKIYTYTYVKEDAFQLYGFISKDELSLFKKLITVSGIGPKGAASILSAFSAEDLRYAIYAGDIKTISKAPGIGKKTAERLVLELKDKVELDYQADTLLGQLADESVGSAEPNNRKDAIEALTALGYSSMDAAKAVKQADPNADMDVDVEDILKAALKYLM